MNTEKKSCTKSCTFNQKCMSNQVDTPFSSPKVCFVFGRIAWPVLCHFCMGSLHYFLFKHHATVPWTFVNLHTSIQEDTKRWHSQCSQGHKQLDVTLAPKPSSDHHYNNYKHHSLFLQNYRERLLNSVLEERDVMPKTEKENTAVSSELLEGNWILYWLFPILFQVY